MTPRRPDRSPLDLHVEQLALGELPPEHAEAIRAQLEATPEGADRLAALAAEDAAIFTRYPARVVAAEIRARVRGARQPRQWIWLPLAAAAAAGLALWARPAPLPLAGALPPPGAFEIERAKGPLTPGLMAFRKVGELAEALAVGDVAQSGDVLQLSYTPRGAEHGIIFSLDGRGAVTLHFPEQPDGDTTLPQGLQTVPLGHAYQLDDAPRFERFFIVTAHRPLPVDSILGQARALANQPQASEHPLDLPTDVAWADLLVRKSQ